MNSEKPSLLRRDPTNKPRSSSWIWLSAIAAIIVGVLAFMIVHMAITPLPPDSASPMEPKKTSR